MKQNKNELDVDFIGGSGPLTKEEEKTVSEFSCKRGVTLEHSAVVCLVLKIG